MWYPASLHLIGFFPGDIATSISLLAVALPFGGTLALTIMATVFNNISGIGPTSPFRDSTTLSTVAEPMKGQIIHQAKVSPATVKSVVSDNRAENCSSDGSRLGVRGYYAVYGFSRSCRFSHTGGA